MLRQETFGCPNKYSPKRIQVSRQFRMLYQRYRTRYEQSKFPSTKTIHGEKKRKEVNSMFSMKTLFSITQVLWLPPTSFDKKRIQFHKQFIML